jgi:FkbM family methyltransferase
MKLPTMLGTSKKLLKEMAKDTLKKLGVGVTSYSNLLALRTLAHFNIQLLLKLPISQVGEILQVLSKSKSQLRQDLFVLSELQFMRDGYFVEFGATNGFDLSNSFLLEKEYGWKGILAEPARIWHESLRLNRSAHIETNCVWKDSESELLFNEAKEGELSTIDRFSASDLHHEARKNGSLYNIMTISLNDMLEKYNAPDHFNYLSIDTEGSELEILRAFDFQRYKIDVITCEHNYTENRNAIYSLLTRHGYERKYEDISQFDDWYVRSDLNRDGKAGE